MSEYSDCLTSIATTIADYRQAELPAPTADHVQRWVTQFDHDFQLAILRELEHVLASTYISRGKAVRFPETVCRSPKLTGGNPCSFWEQVNFLDIQGSGASQKQMLALFGKVLEAQCGLTVQQCGGGSNLLSILTTQFSLVRELVAIWPHGLRVTHLQPQRFTLLRSQHTADAITTNVI